MVWAMPTGAGEGIRTLDPNLGKVDAWPAKASQLSPDTDISEALPTADVAIRPLTW